MKALAFAIFLIMIAPIAVQKSNENIFSGYTNFIYKEGYPVLPYKYETYVFPFGTEIKEIKVEEKNIEKIKLNEKIKPAPAPYPKKFEIKESEIYSKDEFYPSSWYEYEIHAGIEDGKRAIFLTIYLYPFRYNALRNEILHAKDFDIKIDYVLPEKIESLATYDFLIISPDEWINEIEELKQHKESKGIKTIVVGLNEIYSGKYFSSYGRDDAEKVKYFIKNAIEEWGIKYVLLVGGRQGGIFNEKWLMPVRYTNLDDRSGWETGYLSDLYFADIYKYENGSIVFEDWDSNGNGIFAEWKGMKKDKLDLMPDVYVGRIACKNKIELKDVIDKIIDYENNAWGKEWFNKMIVVGGDSWPNAGDPYYEGEEENKAALEYMHGFEAIKLWTSLGTLTGPEDVINAINGGAGFLFFDGHGNPMNWATHPPHSEEWVDGLSLRDMNKLKNKGMYPVCVVGGCHNSQFNVSIINLFKIWNINEWYSYVYKGETAYECWGWKIVRIKNGGAIASLGYTGLDYFAIGNEDGDNLPDCIQYYSGFLHVNFFKEYASGQDIIGVIHANTLIRYINTHNVMKDEIHCKTVQEWVLLGDPTLKIGGYKE
ncbi:MAG: C25 family cysteine peptidase [Candidatus Thermoplasmatota archaeon]